MKRFLGTMLLSGALLFGASIAAFAQNDENSLPANPPQTYPKVSNLTPFSAEANFMSLPGYLRYMVYMDDGIWMDRSQAVSIVNNQIATGGE